MTDLHVGEMRLDQAPWQQLQPLLDVCYPLPPRDVFERVVATSHRLQRLWLARDGQQLLGMVMLSSYSKGGHLENLAVHPAARGRGVALQLVQELLCAVAGTGPAMVTLTTRIPAFFARFGFQACGELEDGSTAMMIFLPASSASLLPTP